MEKRILFEGYDSLSVEEKDAIQAWIKGILAARIAKQKFVQLLLKRNYQYLSEASKKVLLSNMISVGVDYDENINLMISSDFNKPNNIDAGEHIQSIVSSDFSEEEKIEDLIEEWEQINEVIELISMCEKCCNARHRRYSNDFNTCMISCNDSNLENCKQLS